MKLELSDGASSWNLTTYLDVPETVTSLAVANNQATAKVSN